MELDKTNKDTALSGINAIESQQARKKACANTAICQSNLVLSGLAEGQEDFLRIQTGLRGRTERYAKDGPEPAETLRSAGIFFRQDERDIRGELMSQIQLNTSVSNVNIRPEENVNVEQMKPRADQPPKLQNARPSTRGYAPA